MQDSSIEYLPLGGQCCDRASLARGPKGCWSTGYWSLRLGPPPSSAQRSAAAAPHFFMLGSVMAGSAAGVNLNRWDFYMRDMNGNGPGDANPTDSSGKDNDGD